MLLEFLLADARPTWHEDNAVLLVARLFGLLLIDLLHFVFDHVGNDLHVDRARPNDEQRNSVIGSVVLPILEYAYVAGTEIVYGLDVSEQVADVIVDDHTLLFGEHAW